MAVSSAAFAGRSYPSLVTRLREHAAAEPQRDAIATPQLRLSYTELAAIVAAQAARLRQRGVTCDSVVGIECDDDIEHLVICLAAVWTGATSVTIPTHEPASVRERIARNCGVTITVGSEQFVGFGVPAEGVAAQAESASLLFLTSGTTGEPKVVAHRDCDLVAQAHRHISSASERFACLAAMEHNFVKRHRLYCVAAGATNVFPGNDRDRVVARCLELAVNVLHLSAFQARELLATPNANKLGGIRLKLGGSHVTMALRKALRDGVTPCLQAGYGTTETGAIAFTDPDDRDSGESVGRCLPGIELRIVSPDRSDAAPGEAGEIAIRCAGMFRGYAGQPDLTAERLENGWFYTGDIGYLDSERRIHLAGRADDMFVFNSMNIYPQELESRLLEFPGVADAAVVPQASAVHGNIPVALVKFADGAPQDLPGLRQAMADRAGIRSPRKYIIVDEIPRNPSGKIRRDAELKLKAESAYIRRTITEVLKIHAADRVTPAQLGAFEKGEADITLREIEMDSLARMDFLIALEVNHGAIIEPREFWRILTFGEVVNRALAVEPDDPTEQERVPETAAEVVPESQDDPYVIRFFRRAFRYCHTVARLNRALLTLEHRLTPVEFRLLREYHQAHRLLPADTAAKFHTALSIWLTGIERMLRASGKPAAEPFEAHRVSATLTHYTGPPADDKTLLVCFTQQGSRSLMMPNAALLQHTDSRRYDVLVVTEPLNEGYRLGAPLLGSTAMEMLQSLARLELMRNYQRIRTTGCSAGCYPAVVAGYLLGAELAVGVGGRFHSWRFPLRILDRFVTTWRATRSGHCAHVLLSYDIDKTRDRNYSRTIAWLTGGRLAPVGFDDATVGHRVLARLLERGQLGAFLEMTVFAPLDRIAGNEAMVIRLPPVAASH